MRVALILLLILFSGCFEKEILSGLDQRQSLEVVVALNRAGIDAERVSTSAGRNEKFTVSVPESAYRPALELLQELSLPRVSEDALSQLTASNGFVPPTPEMNSLKLDLALGAQVERLLAGVPGVADVRVVVRNNLQGEKPGTASVLIRAEERLEAEEIKTLVAQALPGVQGENISIRLVPFEKSVPSAGVERFSFPFSFHVPAKEKKTAQQQVYAILLLCCVCTVVAGA